MLDIRPRARWTAREALAQAARSRRPCLGEVTLRPARCPGGLSGR